MKISTYLMILIAILLATTISPSYGQASVTNGKIAFSSNMDGDYEIYTINPDGSDLQQLTFNEVRDFSPDWSPDSERISFVSDGTSGNGLLELYVMNADGGEQTLLVDEQNCLSPSWSPDGTKIVYSSDYPSDALSDIFIVNTDGRNVMNLTNNAMLYNIMPFWSSDGDTIYFLSTGNQRVDAFINSFTLYRMDGDGSNISALFEIGGNPSSIDLSYDGTLLVYGVGAQYPVIFTSTLDNSNETAVIEGFDYFAIQPVWSPDGTQIAHLNSSGLAVMNADGTEPRTILEPETTGVTYLDFDWQPILVDPTIDTTSTP